MSSPQSRPQEKSFGLHYAYDKAPPSSASQSMNYSAATYMPAVSRVLCSPSQFSPSPPRLAPKRRRRPSNLSADDPPDAIIGYVTTSGKFRCTESVCSDISFGRQADFRRHYDNVHASSKVEWFCTVEGCGRSKKPTAKSKGRSFGAREDKMREHVRTVHEKLGKRKRDGLTSTAERDEEVKEKEGFSEEEDEPEEMQSKKGRRVKIYEGRETWPSQNRYF